MGRTSNFSPGFRGQDGPRRATNSLQAQRRRILARLLEGPATSAELAALALKYTSRVSEVRRFVRQAGGDIRAARQPDGVWVYTLQDRDA